MGAKSDSFWTFCLSTWEDSALQQPLLEASVHQSLDVVGVLFKTYARNHALSPNAATLFSASRDYFRPVIDQYRQLRRQGKGRVPDALYQQQKQLELQFEKAYAEELASLLSTEGTLCGASLKLSDKEEHMYQFLCNCIDGQAKAP